MTRCPYCNRSFSYNSGFSVLCVNPACAHYDYIYSVQALGDVERILPIRISDSKKYQIVIEIPIDLSIAKELDGTSAVLKYQLTQNHETVAINSMTIKKSQYDYGHVTYFLRPLALSMGDYRMWVIFYPGVLCSAGPGVVVKEAVEDDE